MTAQKLFEILSFIDALDTKLNLQKNLEAISTALSNLASQPAQTQHQSTLASALAEFQKGAEQLGSAITPSQFAIIDALGGARYFDPSIAGEVRSSVEKNAMTPTVARDFVQDLASKRAEFLSTVRNARNELKKLNITRSVLQPGSADLAFLIPREMFDNELVRFAKELTFISRLLQHFSEAVTGEATEAQLEQLSSSVPTVALAAAPGVIAVIALAVDKFLAAWEKIERIRKLRAELADIGMKKTALDELTEQITTTVDEVVEEATTTVMLKYAGSPERKNELSNAIRQDTQRLFGQIERGLAVEFRAEPKKDGDTEEQKVLKDITDLARRMQFPEVAPEPMLLSGGEVIEGELRNVKRSTKKTTTKTVSKKSADTEVKEAGTPKG